MIKKKQFNPEILTKLITEKKNNTSLYKLLNKEGRVDRVINHLESIQQNDNNKSVDNNQNQQDNKITAKIVVGVVLLLVLLGLGMIMLARKKKKEKNQALTQT